MSVKESLRKHFTNNSILNKERIEDLLNAKPKAGQKLFVDAHKSFMRKLVLSMEDEKLTEEEKKVINNKIARCCGFLQSAIK